MRGIKEKMYIQIREICDLASRIRLLFVLCVAITASAGPSRSQDVNLPSFIDQRQRLTQPELPDLSRLRFLTATDYPPFNFLDARGRLVGFNIDLTRAICVELDVLPICQIEALPFGELQEALLEKRGEAIIAGIAIDPQSRNRLSFSQSYLRFPARFVTRKEDPIAAPIAANLSGRVIGLDGGSAHEAMFRAFFPDAQARVFDDRTTALDAVKSGEVDAYFGDGISLSFWLESPRADGCCMFSDGPFLSNQYLGEGLSVAVRAEDSELAEAIDYALVQIVENGTFSELLLRYFPVNPW
ncbi:ABC transporter, periplasmic amino acid-binding protein [Fulvimarina pelagi HTCC2506]|uniref:ABC transporter, periplasmic amino acid-binding protein n=1 Tax=Fulvimarina pelagi HTCC2506 TaxID=314231 RepID=Q0G6A5_9HYPH|nr:transporter substrate-binding domain-containing protein [Fulvimarina pelagi]EAU42809.1 ABC transporter, periplasmic amino acid-binding protein [Fulvimarina pelagi HTCC2506]